MNDQLKVPLLLKLFQNLQKQEELTKILASYTTTTNNMCGNNSSYAPTNNICSNNNSNRIPNNNRHDANTYSSSQQIR